MMPTMSSPPRSPIPPMSPGSTSGPRWLRLPRHPLAADVPRRAVRRGDGASAERHPCALRRRRGRVLAPPPPRSTGCSTSTFHACWKPRIAKTMSSSCSGMSSAVSSPTTSAESAGSVKPGRSRSYQPGHGDQGEDGEHDRQRRGHRQHAAAPARDEEREHDVEQDVDHLQRLRAHQLVPRAERDDRHHQRGDEQEHDDDHARHLRGRLLAVGMLDLDAVGGHPRATIQSRACRRDRRPSPCGRGGTGRRARFRSSCRKAWGFESLRPHWMGEITLHLGDITTRRRRRRDRERREPEPARRRRGRRRDPPRRRPAPARGVPHARRLPDRRREGSPAPAISR